MRTIAAAILIVGGIGVIGASGGSAAPLGGAPLDRAASAASPFTPVHYYRWHHRICYSKCYYDFFVGHRVCRRFC